MQIKPRRSLLLALVILFVTSLGHSLFAGRGRGPEDVGYSVARLATTGTMLSLPFEELEAYLSTYPLIVPVNGNVALALYFYGIAVYNYDNYALVGRHYYAYFRLLYVLDHPVGAVNPTTFDNANNAANYLDDYEDYGFAIWKAYVEVSDLYKKAAGMGGTEHFSLPSIAGQGGVNYSSWTTGSYQNYRYSTYTSYGSNSSAFGAQAALDEDPWNFKKQAPNSAAAITSPNSGVAAWQLAQYYVAGALAGSTLHLSAAIAAYNAGAAYDNNAALSLYYANLARYQSQVYLDQASIYGAAYYYYAAVTTGALNTMYESAGFSAITGNMNVAESIFLQWAPAIQSSFTASEIDEY